MKKRKKQSLVSKITTTIITTALFTFFICGSVWLVVKSIQLLINLF